MSAEINITARNTQAMATLARTQQTARQVSRDIILASERTVQALYYTLGVFGESIDIMYQMQIQASIRLLQTAVTVYSLQAAANPAAALRAGVLGAIEFNLIVAQIHALQQDRQDTARRLQSAQNLLRLTGGMYYY